jgi:hypothetical protein
MDSNTLKARIVADVSGLKKGMVEAAESLDHLTEAERRAIQEAKKLQKHNENVNRSYQGLSRSTGASTVVFQEFNRVIQDAPFGMMGVGNNLQQLASNFGALATKSGGTGNAIKIAMKSMVVGINPVILAVTAITTALTLMEMGAFKSKDTVKSFAEELETFKGTLDAVTRATLEGAGNAAKEAQAFQLLTMQAENANIPMKVRLEAVDKLQKDYPDYLKNLTSEQILTGDVGTAYGDLTKQIIATAKARAFSDEIAKNSMTILTTEARLMERVNKLAELDRQRSKIQDSGQATSVATAGGLMETEAGNRLSKIQGEINDLIKEQLVDVAEVSKINDVNLTLQESITGQIENGAKFTKETADGMDKVKTAAELTADAFKTFSKAQGEVNRIFFAEGKFAYEEFNDQLKEALATQKKFEELAAGIVTADEKKKDPFGVNNVDFTKGFKPKVEKADVYDPSEELDAIAAKAKMTEAAFDGLGSAISRAFGGGNEWGAFLSGFIKFAGEVIARNFAITQSNMIAGASATGAASGPAAAFVTPGLITAGLALAGSLFAALMGGKASGGAGGAASGASKNYGLPKREKGGPVSAGQAYIVGEKRPEVFVPRTSGMILPRVSDYASNTSASGSGRASSKMKIEVYGVISNEAIKISNKRGERKANKT